MTAAAEPATGSKSRSPVTRAKDALAAVDRRQRAFPPAAVAYGVVKKFGDDRANQYVVSLGWYGFLAIYPALLAAVTILAYVGAPSLGHGLITTLHKFPVVGTEFNPEKGSASLHGSLPALIIGILGLIYGAQGVTQTAQQAMFGVWNVAPVDQPGFLPRLGRSLLGLGLIGAAAVVNAYLASVATSGGDVWHWAVILGLLLINIGFYWAAFRALTPGAVRATALLPGAAFGAFGFTVLTTLGSGLVQHQLQHSSSSYGQFGAVIGLVAFLFLMAKVSLYGAELNPVLERHLWPRALVSADPTAADDRVLHDLVHQERRRADQAIGVGFGEEASQAAARDAEVDSSSDGGPAEDH